MRPFSENRHRISRLFPGAEADRALLPLRLYAPRAMERHALFTL